MSQTFRTLAVSAAVGVAALTACSSGGSGRAVEGAGATAAPVVAGDLIDGLAASAAPATTAGDQAWNKADEVAIALKGRSATASKAGVEIAGSTVTITRSGTYRLSGTLEGGGIVVASSDDGIVRLVLDGVDIRSDSTSALAAMDAGEVVVVLADGSTNVLADAATYRFPDSATDGPNAALFSAADLTISGGGSLTVKGSFNDGIASKDGLVVAGGTIAVDALDDGIRGKDYVVINGGTLTVNAGGDAVKADNAEDPAKGYVTVNAGKLGLTAGGDGISAATNLVVADGVIDVTAGGGNTRTVATGASAKGLKGAALVTIGSGTISIDSADDAVHSDTRVVFNGGSTSIRTGDDGVHADATLQVNGGTIRVTKSYEGLESSALTLAGGDISVVSSDDGINAAGGVDGSGAVAPGGARRDAFAAGAHTLTITGGRIVVDSGGDGLDVNGSATMTDGTVIVHGPTARNNSAVDYDGTFTISGGLLVGAGSSGMVMAPTAASPQGSLLKTFTNQTAGTVVHIESAGGGLLTFTPSKAFQSIVVSSAAVSRGVTYSVSLGGSASGAGADGLYEAGAYSGGAAAGTIAAAG